MKIKCKLFGHNPENVNTEKFTARCSGCGTYLKVGYDMNSGETFVTRELTREEFIQINEYKGETSDVINVREG